MNFLKQVMQQLDDQSLGLLGAVLGENESKVRDGVKSAVPKILGAMVSATKVDQGRAMLWRELRDTDTTVASSFSKQMYYKDSRALVATGHDQLDGLIGAETNRLIRSVSRESDIGSTSAKRLVGAVTPLVFASVANYQQSKNLSQNELGNILEQQQHHLSDWERQSDHYFSSVYKSDQQNEPLFSDLPKEGGSAVTATAIASASLGAHHFRDSDEDQESSAGDKDSDPTSGAGQSESVQGFDQRSKDRRDREPIAVNPTQSGFGVSTANEDRATKSTTAGAIAATGAAAVGAAGVAAAALTPSAKQTKKNPSGDADSDASGTSTINTYDSKNAVSGFAAADSGTSITTSQTETKSDSDGKAETGDSGPSSRLWTPDSAQQRSTDGTLQYSDRAATANAGGNAHSAGQTSGGWFHWLWWPVLFFGSLLALCILFLNPDGRNSQPNAEDNPAAVAAAAEDDETSTDAAVDENTEGTSEETDSDDSSSSIQITLDESDNTDKTDNTDNTDKAVDLVDPSDETSTGAENTENADPGNQAENSSASNAENTDSPMPKTGDESSKESSDAVQDEVPSLEGSIEVDETADAGEEADSEGQADSDDEVEDSGEDADSSSEGNSAGTELTVTDLEIDADEQVEEFLSAIETELKEVKDEAQAKAAEKSLSEHISGLEALLNGRAQWEDEIEILVDFQLEEGQKMIAQARKKIFQSDAAKQVLKGKFKELNALMKTTGDSQE